MSASGYQAVIFTDLDGTLLDHDQYDWSAAAPALSRLAARRVPVCLCTSKTVAELRPLRRALDNDAPLAAENGAVIAVPRGYFDGVDSLDPDDLEIRTLGADYADLRRLACRLRTLHGYRYTGFGDMDVDAVMRATGLEREAAARARERAGSEPLLWEDDAAAEQDFVRRVEAASRFARRGGRFLHLLGAADKAAALTHLKQRFATAYGPILAVALGDAANDAGMLAAADIGYWVARPDGQYHAPAAGHVRHAPGIGPVGWAAAVNALIDDGVM